MMRAQKLVNSVYIYVYINKTDRVYEPCKFHADQSKCQYSSSPFCWHFNFWHQVWKSYSA